MSTEQLSPVSTELPQGKSCVKCWQELAYTRQFCPYCQTMQPSKPIAAFKACQRILDALDDIQANGLPVTDEMVEPIVERLTDTKWDGEGALAGGVFYSALHEFFFDYFNSQHDLPGEDA